MTDKVIFTLITAANGKQIGHAQLNKPQALNALDLDMVQLLLPQLQAWQQAPNIVAVFLDGVGEKAFCAGGDVVAMHDAMKAAPNAVPQTVETFFTEEYRLDYLIHTFKKPFIVWGAGIVMGGGLGLFAGASQRIVTETSRIAMPEITIGLYPDVGGSWFLNAMPDGIGLFLGLTAASVNATDMLHIGLADHFIENSAKNAFVKALASIDWCDAVSINQQKCAALCQQFEVTSAAAFPNAILKPMQSLIQACTNAQSIEQVIGNILESQSPDNTWWQKAQQTLAKGSMLSAAIVFEQLKRAQNMSLAECLRMELILSCRCAQMGEFQEGVRALLIDKDCQPQWQYRAISEVTPDVLEQCFTSLWPATSHPLHDLGSKYE